MPDFITNGEGNFFTQLLRSEPHEWLTCTGVGDIEIPERERTPEFCPDPLNSGDFKIAGFVRGDVSAGTYSLTKPIATVYNFLLQAKCDFVGRINWVCRGMREDPRNYELAVLLFDTEFSSRRIPTPVRGPGDAEARVNTNGTLNYMDFLMLYPVTAVRQTLTNIADAHDVFFLPERCEDRCGPARQLCQHGIMGLESAGGYMYDTEVKKTLDGSSWEQTPLDPFTWGGDVYAVWVLETLQGERYIAFRGERVPGAPAEAAYSDDRGVTWTNVPVGPITGLGRGIRGVTAVGAKLVIVLTDGYVYASVDGAASWQLKEAGVETTEDLNDIAFSPTDPTMGFIVGDNDELLLSVDSGETWDAGPSVVAGRNLLSIDTNDKGHLFVGTNDGRIFRSDSDGDAGTWVEWYNLTGGTVPWIRFDPQVDYVGYAIHNTGAAVGTLHRSEDGGGTWYPVPDVPANLGLNGGFVCDANNVVVVGNQAADGFTFVAKVYPY